MPNNYEDIPINHQFLTGLFTILHPSVIGPMWDCIPFTVDEIEGILTNHQVNIDQTRMNWHFGQRKKESGKSGELERVKSAALWTPEQLRLYSWLVSVSETQPFNIDDVLKDRNFLLKFISKINAIETRLVAANLREKDLRVDGIMELAQYLDSEHITVEKVKEFINRILNSLEPYSSFLNKSGDDKNEEKETPRQEFFQSISTLRKKPKDKKETDLDLNLTLEESKALFVFTDTLGNGTVLQSGCVWGVEANCFRTGWLYESQDIYTEMKPNSSTKYEEQWRLRRLPNGKISVSTCLEATKVINTSGDELAKEHADLATPGAQRLFKFSSEQVLERHISQSGGVTYSMTPQPQGQSLKMEREFLNTVALKNAMEKLIMLRDAGEVLTPVHFFVFIPYIKHDKFRDVFLETMARQPEFVSAFAMKWISICYQDDSQFLKIIGDAFRGKTDLVDEESSSQKTLLKKVTQKVTNVTQKLTLSEVKTIPVPKLLKAVLQSQTEPKLLEAYSGYLNDRITRDSFFEEIAIEIGELVHEDRQTVLKILDEGKIFWGDSYKTLIEHITQYLKKVDAATKGEEKQEMTNLSVNSGSPRQKQADVDLSSNQHPSLSNQVESESKGPIVDLDAEFATLRTISTAASTTKEQVTANSALSQSSISGGGANSFGRSSSSVSLSSVDSDPSLSPRGAEPDDLEERKSYEYKVIPMPYTFLTEFSEHVRVSREREREYKDPLPRSFNNEQISKLVQTQGSRDRHRTPWSFGPLVWDVRTGEFHETEGLLNLFPEHLKLVSELDPQLIAQVLDSDEDVDLNEEVKKRAISRFKDKLREMQVLLSRYPQIKHPWKAAENDADALDQTDFNSPDEISQALQWYHEGIDLLKGVGYQQIPTLDSSAPGAVNLTLNESRALTAYSCTVADGDWEQGGCTRRVTDNSFGTIWMDLFNIQFQKSTAVTEGNRLERLPDGRIKVVSTFAARIAPWENQDGESVDTPRDENAKFLAKIYLEQILEEQNGVFSLTEQRVHVSVDQNFWKNGILVRARSLLSNLHSPITETDAFALIPCLCDEDFRKEFCQKIAKLGLAEHDRVLPWIELCYAERPAELAAIKELLSAELATAHKNKYRKIPMPYAFLTGLAQEYLFNGADPTPQSASTVKIKKEIESPEARKDRERTFFSFGKKRKDSKTGEFQITKQIAGLSPAYLKLVSELDPEKLEQGLSSAILGEKERRNNEEKGSGDEISEEAVQAVINQTAKEMAIAHLQEKLDRMKMLLNYETLDVEWKPTSTQIQGNQQDAGVEQEETITPRASLTDTPEEIERALIWLENKTALLQKRGVWWASNIDNDSLSDNIRQMNSILSSVDQADLNQADIQKLNVSSLNLDSPDEVRSIFEWFQKAGNFLFEKNVLYPPARKSALPRQQLTLEESQAIFYYASHVGNGDFFQGGSTAGVTSDFFVFRWLSNGFNLLLSQDCVSDDNRIERLPNGKIKITSTWAARKWVPTDVLSSDLNGPRDPNADYLVKIHLEQTLEKVNGGFKLSSPKLRVEMEHDFYENVLLPRAKSAILPENLPENFKLEKIVLYSLIPCLSDAEFRNDFCKVLAKQSRKEYDEAKRLIELWYQGQPDKLQELQEIKSKLRKERIKHFFVANKPRTFVICLGIALGITGAALAATGVLAPLGVAMGLAGAAMATPGAVAGVAGTCLLAPSVVYGLGVLAVKTLKGLAACVRSIKDRMSKHEEAVSMQHLPDEIPSADSSPSLPPSSNSIKSKRGRGTKHIKNRIAESPSSYRSTSSQEAKLETPKADEVKRGEQQVKEVIVEWEPWSDMLPNQQNDDQSQSVPVAPAMPTLGKRRSSNDNDVS